MNQPDNTKNGQKSSSSELQPPTAAPAGSESVLNVEEALKEAGMSVWIHTMWIR